MQINGKECKLCPDEDKSLAASISSLVSQVENKDIMSAQTQTVQPFIRRQEVQTIQEQQPKQSIQEEEKKEELKNINIPKEDYDRLLKEVEGKKQQEAQLQQLITENKTTKLNKIFESVKDESLKKTLFDKYFNADVNQLNDFYQDVTAHVFPSLVEAAKAEAEKELKNKTVEENKGKSKAGSLPKEPVVEENSKAGSNLVPNSVNQVKIFDRLMRGEF